MALKPSIVLCQAATAQRLREETSEAAEALQQREKLQAMVQDAHASLTSLQARLTALWRQRLTLECNI